MLVKSPTRKIFYRNPKFQKYVIVPLIIRKQVEQILHVKYPEMTGGFFFGESKDEYRIIKKIWPIKNICDHPKVNSFDFATQDLEKAKLFALQWKMDLIGLFHSNPNCRSLPSLKDLEIALPLHSLVIISIQNGIIQDWTSWYLNASATSFKEEKVIL